MAFSRTKLVASVTSKKLTSSFSQNSFQSSPKNNRYARSTKISYSVTVPNDDGHEKFPTGGHGGEPVMTGDYGISANNQGKGIQAFIHRHYRLLTLAVVLVLLGAGIGLWVSLPASVAHPPIRKYSGKQFPPPVLSYPSLKKLDRQIAKITPPWKQILSTQKTFIEKHPYPYIYYSNGAFLAPSTYYSAPLCTHLKVTMPEFVKNLEHWGGYPVNGGTELTIENLSAHSCDLLFTEFYDGSSVCLPGCQQANRFGNYASFTCLPTILIYDNSGNLRYGFDYKTINTGVGGFMCSEEGGILLRSGHSWSGHMSDIGVNYFTEYGKSVPPGRYSAVAAIGLGYIPPLCPLKSQCASTTAVHSYACNYYYRPHVRGPTLGCSSVPKVHVYYSKPMMVTVP